MRSRDVGRRDQTADVVVQCVRHDEEQSAERGLVVPVLVVILLRVAQKAAVLDVVGRRSLPRSVIWTGRPLGSQLLPVPHRADASQKRIGSADRQNSFGAFRSKPASCHLIGVASGAVLAVALAEAHQSAGIGGDNLASKSVSSSSGRTISGSAWKWYDTHLAPDPSKRL
jgi:hypothetical protein